MEINVMCPKYKVRVTALSPLKSGDVRATYLDARGALKSVDISEYEAQALQFLDDTKCELTITHLFKGPYFDDSEEKRDVYAFTLKTSKDVYSAKFGDSLLDTRRRAFAMTCRGFSLEVRTKQEQKALAFYGHKVPIKMLKEWKRGPSAYDILACLSGSEPPLTFKDFCSEYGYDDLPLSEAPRIQKIHQSVIEEWGGMRRLFTPDQLEQLGEIC